MEKESVRISLLLFSEDNTYVIMEDPMTNRLIDSSYFDQRIGNVSLTTPYKVCVLMNRTDEYPNGCVPELSQKVSMTRIVRTSDGDLVPMSIILFQNRNG